MTLNEADTRTQLIDPVLHASGWTEDLIRREETLGTVEIPLPGLDLQRAAAESLSLKVASIDALIGGQERRIEALEGLPSAILNRSFDEVDSAMAFGSSWEVPGATY